MITNIIINTILQFKKIKLYFLNKKNNNNNKEVSQPVPLQTAIRWHSNPSSLTIYATGLIGVLKTVMYYGYSGISRQTNLLSEDLYISQETFLCSIPDTIP